MSPLTTISRIIGFLFALILVFTLPLAILVFDVGRVVFDVPLVKRVTTEIVTESDLIPAGLAWFSEAEAERRYTAGEAEAWVGEPDVVRLMGFFDVNHWRTIRFEVLPDEILAEWVSVSVDGTYAWIDSEDRIPQITWNMQSFIERVDGPHGEKAITIAYGALPACIEEQIADFTTRLDANPPGTEVLYNLCEFPNPWHEDQFSDYIESLEDLVNEIPKQFALTDELSQVEDTQGVGPETIKRQLRLTRTLMDLAPFVPLVLLMLILIFAVRSLKGLGRWWGIPLIMSSVIAMIVAVAYRFAITWLLSFGPLSEVPPLVRDETISGVLRLASEVFRPMLLQTVIIFVFSLILVIIGSVVKEKQKTE